MTFFLSELVHNLLEINIIENQKIKVNDWLVELLFNLSLIKLWCTDFIVGFNGP